MKPRLMEGVSDRSSAEPALMDAGGDGASPVEGCVCGAGLIWPLGSAAFAFGMIDHLSLKVCASAEFMCDPIHTDATRIAVTERTRTIASQLA
jgi:hypothetical protein